MSDPIMNDFASVTPLTDDRLLLGLKRLARLDRRAKPMDGALGLVELIDMCGLSDVASQIVGRPLRADGAATIRGQRDQSESPPAADTASGDDVPAPSGRHGVNGRCSSGLHPWVAENIRKAEKSSRLKCRPCEQFRKRGGSTVLRDPDGRRLCGCPGVKHVLTEVSSETTFVSETTGRRMCRAGERRRKSEKAARGRAATEARKAEMA